MSLDQRSLVLLVGLPIYLTPVVLCVMGAVLLWNKSSRAHPNRRDRDNYRIAALILVLIGAAIVIALFFGA